MTKSSHIDSIVSYAFPNPLDAMYEPWLSFSVTFNWTPKNESITLPFVTADQLCEILNELKDKLLTGAVTNLAVFPESLLRLEQDESFDPSASCPEKLVSDEYGDGSYRDLLLGSECSAYANSLYDRQQEMLKWKVFANSPYSNEKESQLAG